MAFALAPRCILFSFIRFALPLSLVLINPLLLVLDALTISECGELSW